MNYPHTANSPHRKRDYSKPQLTAQNLWHPIMQGSLPIGIKKHREIDWGLDWWLMPFEPQELDF